MRILGAGTLVFNMVIAIALVGAEIWRGGKFSTPWDGPAIATLVLASSTLVLTAVAVLAAMLSVWGFTTIREHAGKIASEAVEKSTNAAAEAAAERFVKSGLAFPEIRPLTK